MMHNSLLRLRLRLAGRRAALISLLLMLWVIPTVGAAATAPAMAPVALDAPVDPCDQLDKDSAAYDYCKGDDTSDSGSQDTDSGSATQAKDKDDEDPCELLEGTPGYDYCNREEDGGNGSALEDITGAACDSAPSVEAPGQGILGWIDAGPEEAPPARDPSAANADAYIYEQYGYAGLKWNTYNLACSDGVSGALKSAGSQNDNWFANKAFTWSKAWTALAVVMRQYATDDSLFGSLDPVIEQATKAVRNAVFSPWIGTSLVLLGVVIIFQARKRNLPDVMSQIAWALLVLTAATAVASYPVEASKVADKAINTTISAIDQAFAASDTPASGASGSSAGSGGGNATPANYPGDSGPGPYEGADGDIRAEGNTAHGNMLVHNVLYSAWLRGELGDDDSAVARKYGMELFDSQALTWAENRLPDDERADVIRGKQARFKEIASAIEKEDPTAYAHLTGQESGRLGAAGISNVQALVSNTFSLVGDLVIVCGKWMLRLIVILFPGLAVIGLHRRTSGVVKTAFNGTMAAVVNVPLFAAGSNVDILVVRELGDTQVDLPMPVKIVVMGVVAYVLWRILRPIARLSSMVNPNHNWLEDAGRGVTGPARFAKGYAKYYLGTRYLRKFLGRQTDALEAIAEGSDNDHPRYGREDEGYMANRGNWPYSRPRGQQPDGGVPSDGGIPSGGGGGSAVEPVDLYSGYEPDSDDYGRAGGSYGRAGGTFVPAGDLTAGARVDDVWDAEGWFVEDLPAAGRSRSALPAAATAGGSTGVNGASRAGGGSRSPLPPSGGAGGGTVGDVPLPRAGSDSPTAQPPLPGGRPHSDGPGNIAPQGHRTPRQDRLPSSDSMPPAPAPEGSRPTPIPDSAEPRVVPPSHTEDGGTVYVLFSPDEGGFILRDERDEDGGEQ